MATNFSVIGFPQRYDPQLVGADRECENMQSAVDHAYRDEPDFAVVAPVVDFDDGAAELEASRQFESKTARRISSVGLAFDRVENNRKRLQSFLVHAFNVQTKIPRRKPQSIGVAPLEPAA